MKVLGALLGAAMGCLADVVVLPTATVDTNAKTWVGLIVIMVPTVIGYALGAASRRGR